MKQKVLFLLILSFYLVNLQACRNGEKADIEAVNQSQDNKLQKNPASKNSEDELHIAGIKEIRPSTFTWKNLSSTQKVDSKDINIQDEKEVKINCLKVYLFSPLDTPDKQLSITALELVGEESTFIRAERIDLFIEDFSEFKGTLICLGSKPCSITTTTPIALVKSKLEGDFIFHKAPFERGVALESFCDNPECGKFKHKRCHFQKGNKSPKEGWTITFDNATKTCPVCGRFKKFQLKFSDCRYVCEIQSCSKGIIITYPVATANGAVYPELINKGIDDHIGLELKASGKVRIWISGKSSNENLGPDDN